MQWLLAFLKALFIAPTPSNSALNAPQNDVITKPDPTPMPTENTQPTQKYDWSTPEAARHSARVIMDNKGITHDTINVDGVAHSAKDVLCACIRQESGFNPHAVGRINPDGTQDFGLLQFNNGHNPHTGKPYWIGPGAAFASIQDVFDHPERNVEIFVDCYKYGQLRLWASYSTGAFKQWL